MVKPNTGIGASPSYQHEQGRFVGFGGLSLYYQVWRTVARPLATLVIVHGLSEHSGRYMRLVNTLLPAGVNVYAFDHRGHGRSSDERVAHINSWDEYRGDVGAFLELVVAREPDVPLFLMGHSMGGLISANYVLHHPSGLDGVILSAPPLGDMNISPLLWLLGQGLSLVRPETVFQSGLDLTGISRDPEVLNAYREDPYIHGRVTARWGVEFLRTINWTRDRAHQFSPPLLILHGDADRLVPIAGSRAFFHRVAHQDKRFISYQGGYHESLGDIHHEQVLRDISNWLLGRLEPARPSGND